MTIQNRITPEQIRAARALLRMSQQDLSFQTGVSIATIKRMERGKGSMSGTYENVTAVIDCLKARGVEFIPANGGGVGVRLEKIPTDQDNNKITNAKSA